MQRFTLILLCLLLLAMAAPAQNTDDVHIQPRTVPERPPADVADDPELRANTKPIRKNVDLVLVPVTVTDQMNRLVTGLEREHFVVSEGGDEQEIKHFSSEDSPLSIGVIFDLSSSMKNKFDKSREAVVEFFKTANPQDEFFMISFADKPELVEDFTGSYEEIQNKLVMMAPQGRTALLDGIYYGMNKMRDARHQKKALLIISDGGDNRSRYTSGEIKTMVREADVQIYAIGIYDAVATTAEEAGGPELLRDVAEVTGGRAFTIDNVNDLADVATKIGIELRNQYVLGYRPTRAAHDGKWRKIKVKLQPPKGLPPLQVYAKTGYYAPSE